jgi:hypothetical protein
LRHTFIKAAGWGISQTKLEIILSFCLIFPCMTMSSIPDILFEFSGFLLQLTKNVATIKLNEENLRLFGQIQKCIEIVKLVLQGRNITFHKHLHLNKFVGNFKSDKSGCSYIRKWMKYIQTWINCVQRQTWFGVFNVNESAQGIFTFKSLLTPFEVDFNYEAYERVVKSMICTVRNPKNSDPCRPVVLNRFCSADP